MKNTSHLIGKIKDSTNDLLEALSNFPEHFFNERPAQESWSAANVAEHLIILEGFVNHILTGQVEQIKGRDAVQKIESIRSNFLDFDKKLSAGGPINPSGRMLDKGEIIKLFKQNRQRFTEIIESQDLALECQDFKHALFGTLTRIEWAYFNIYHGERHLQQINGLLEVYSNNV